MSSEIEKQHKEALQEKAFAMYVDGHNMTEIGKAIGRHRNTVRKYIEEYASGLDPADRVARQNISIERLDKVVSHAFDLLENGDIKDSSLTRPQLLHQVIVAIKEQNKISGLHISQLHIQHEIAGTTVVDMMKGIAADMGNRNADDYLNEGLTPGEHVFDGYAAVGILADNGRDVLDEETGKTIGTLDNGTFIQDAEVIEGPYEN